MQRPDRRAFPATKRSMGLSRGDHVIRPCPECGGRGRVTLGDTLSSKGQLIRNGVAPCPRCRWRKVVDSPMLTQHRIDAALRKLSEVTE